VTNSDGAEVSAAQVVVVRRVAGQLRCSPLAQLYEESTDPASSFVRVTASEELDLVGIVPPDVRKADDAVVSPHDERVTKRFRRVAVNPRADVLRGRSCDSLMSQRAGVEELGELVDVVICRRTTSNGWFMVSPFGPNAKASLASRLPRRATGVGSTSAARRGSTP
jgi:hypothetical protein